MEHWVWLEVLRGGALGVARGFKGWSTGCGWRL